MGMFPIVSHHIGKDKIIFPLATMAELPQFPMSFFDMNLESPGQDLHRVTLSSVQDLINGGQLVGVVNGEGHLGK